MTAKKSVKWRVSGEESRGRVGSIEGSPLKIDIRYSFSRRCYEIRFAGIVRDREFSEVNKAKRYAEEQAPAWLAEHQRKLEDEARRKEEEKIEHLAMTRELEQIVTRLAGHGVPCRAMGGIFLRLDVAAKVVGMLDQLRTIEERGAV